jgi:GntR family transcriptional regulator
VAIPHHQQLTETLLLQIADGTLAVGDRLPTEEELSTLHGLARGTVRRALGRIEDLGMISRRPGAGTIVISPAPVAGYQPLAQSAVDIVALAAETRLVDPKASEVILDSYRAKRLGARKGSSWFVIEGVRALRKGDSTPLCWSEQYLRG